MIRITFKPSDRPAVDVVAPPSQTATIMRNGIKSAIRFDQMKLSDLACAIVRFGQRLGTYIDHVERGTETAELCPIIRIENL